MANVFKPVPSNTSYLIDTEVAAERMYLILANDKSLPMMVRMLFKRMATEEKEHKHNLVVLNNTKNRDLIDASIFNARCSPNIKMN
jgi:rubrerythrin